MHLPVPSGDKNVSVAMSMADMEQLMAVICSVLETTGTLQMRYVGVAMPTQ